MLNPVISHPNSSLKWAQSFKCHSAECSTARQPLPPRAMIGAVCRALLFAPITVRAVGRLAAIAHFPVVGSLLLCSSLPTTHALRGFPWSRDRHDRPPLGLMVLYIPPYQLPIELYTFWKDLSIIEFRKKSIRILSNILGVASGVQH